MSLLGRIRLGGCVVGKMNDLDSVTTLLVSSIGSSGTSIRCGTSAGSYCNGTSAFDRIEFNFRIAKLSVKLTDTTFSCCANAGGGKYWRFRSDNPPAGIRWDTSQFAVANIAKSPTTLSFWKYSQFQITFFEHKIFNYNVFNIWWPFRAIGN